MVRHRSAIPVIDIFAGLVFDQIAPDLSDSAEALRREGRTYQRRRIYRLRAATRSKLFTSPADYLVRCEQYGVLQAWRRVMIVSMRDDLNSARLGVLMSLPGPSVDEMIRDLPTLRSGLSRKANGGAAREPVPFVHFCYQER